jgi:hypothetical protein
VPPILGFLIRLPLGRDEREVELGETKLEVRSIGARKQQKSSCVDDDLGKELSRDWSQLKVEEIWTVAPTRVN